jgi:hypothetical protein
VLPVQAAELAVRWTLAPQARTGGAAEGTAQETDAWSAGRSTAGQRALRLAGERAAACTE